MNFYKGAINPENNDVVYVFGSNPEGRHGKGSAWIALKNFGAVYGIGEGLQGNSYAIPTKDLRVKNNGGLRSISQEKIKESIRKFYDVARSIPDKKFMVAYRNKKDVATLNGYTGLEMMSMFIYALHKDERIPDNVYFSQEWKDIYNYMMDKDPDLFYKEMNEVIKLDSNCCTGQHMLHENVLF